MHVAAAICFVAGSFLAMVAGIGIARFPDLLARMHAATKPQVLGLALLMAGLALEIRTGVVIWTLVLVVALQLITAPVSAHMVGRAGYRTDQVRDDLLVVDELTQDLAEIERTTPAGVRPSGASAPASGEAPGESEGDEVMATTDPRPHEEPHER
nr:monovalent cation/H(+) antiporter subunit G [Litorihabitans aurantiacus]